MDERFTRVEDEYFGLRGRLSSGLITQEQFEAALKELVVQDDQGRYWMVGADTGQWYVNDGQTWVPAQPPGRATSAPATLPGQTTPPPATLPAYSNATAGGRGTSPLILAAAAIAALLVIGGLAVIVLRSGTLSSAQIIVTATPLAPAAALATSQPTIRPPTQAALIPTATAASTVLAPMSTTAAQTAASATTVPTTEPPTAASTATTLPTLAPTALPPSPTLQPTRKPALVLPTATAAPVATSTPAAPPGVYVTNMRVDPTEPKNLQHLTFFPTFLNTTGSAQNYKWCAEFFQPDNFKKSFGITPCTNGTVPAGTSELATDPNWRIVSGGSCIAFLARVVYIDTSNARVPFLKPDGGDFWFSFQVCPA